MLKDMGSPPPMRGKGNNQGWTSHRHRITPAYAGKSSHTRRCPSIDWDHPRLCGEKRLFVLYHRFQTGSPPPMRGKGLCTMTQRCIRRITPAYAGKSNSSGTRLNMN